MMTVEEFLSQGYNLKTRIRSCREEIKELRELASSVSAPSLEPHYNPNPNTKAPFEKSLMKIYELEERLDKMLSTLIDYKSQVKSFIGSVPDEMDQYILQEHYLHNRSFAVIADYCDVNRSTIKRRHDRMMAELKVPEDAVDVGKLWDYDIY